ncbi:hypothetical protein E4U09_006313 [Claviceps aff. purpurea]|uniref:Uncharacterized protein n=1 Tax=Claviceps aff. purpurea TaxID=1967640 RepID=A0A9P7QKJ8_9HYPO|nr:hypothetical protein E4U09_006313 [Claviceps aff. purpurea]
MADGTTTPPAAATGRVTHSTAQAAASTSSASHDTAEYLRLSRYATINQHSTTLDIDNKLAYLYNHYVEHGKTHEMLRRTFCEDCDSRVLDYSHLGKGKFPPAPRNARPP